MSIRERCDEIMKDVDHNSFDSTEGAMERLLDLLENEGDASTTDDVEYVLTKAEQLKEESKSILKKERQELVNTAKKHGISLSSLGIPEDYDIGSNDDDDSDEEESNDKEDDLNTTIKRLKSHNSIANPDSKENEEREKIERIKELIKNSGNTNDDDDKESEKNAKPKQANTKTKSAESNQENEKTTEGCCLLL